VQRLGDDIAVGGKAFRDGEVDAALVDVGDGDGRAARLAGHGGGEEADGASADDEGRGARGGLGPVDGVDGDGQRLEEGGGIERDAVRQPV